MAVRISRERAIVEVLAQQTEFPELIRDVLADVGNRPVRAHDHLVVLRARLARERLGRHHPTAGVLAFGFEIDRFVLLQQLERGRPKAQMQDLALAGQHVVLDAQP